MSYATQLPASAKRLYAGGTIGMGGGKLTGTIVYSFAYKDLLAALTVISGTWETITVAGISFKRIIPLRHEDFPNGLIAASVRLRETGYDAANKTYSTCICEVAYESPAYPLDSGQPFMVIDKHTGTQVITMPGRAYTFPSGKQPSLDVARKVPVVDFSVTRFFVTDLDDSLVLSLVGCVNTTTLLGCSAGTLLFNGEDTVTQVSTSFQSQFQQTFAFSYRPVSWNSLMQDSGSFDIPTDSGSNTIHPSADLTPLFQF